jgi:ribosomal-protein-alanine N-acetyltransferase
MFDVALPDDTSPQQAFDAAEAHFASAGTRCWSWVMNPAAAKTRTEPMAEFLRARGYICEANDVRVLKSFPTDPLREVGDLTIIPARASFRHARAIADEIARDSNVPALADAFMLHLDDSHTDSLLALRGGVAAGYLAVLAVGEIGNIAHLYISAPYRGQGIGRTLMSRALEICARSLFKHVFLEVEPRNVAAMRLYDRCGFRKIGQMVTYRAPA